MAKTMTRKRRPATSVRQLVRDREVEDLALKRVDEVERERAERARAEERERAPLIEHAREALGDELVPRGGRLSEAERADTKPPPRAPWWAESIGLSEEESRELAGAPVKWAGDPVAVPR